MKQLSLSKRILNYIRKQYPEQVHKGKIEELAKNATYLKRGIICHYLADNATRRLREMTSGILSNGKTCEIVLEHKKGYYKATPPKEINQYTIEDGTIKIINKW